MSLDLETVMVDAFGLRTASPLQRALWRIIDGRPLADLATDPTVLAAVGNVSALPVGVRPTEVDVIAGVRTAKSMTAAGAAFRATQSVDVSKLGPGEVPRVSIVSLSRDLGAVTFSHLTGQVMANPRLRKLVIGEPKEERIVFRHPSGKPVEVCVVAASRAGGSLVARWSAGVIFDESCRMVGELDGAVVNLDDMIAAVEGRLLPGAQILAIGSPWAPLGPIYDRAQKYGGQPSRDLVVVRGTGPSLNPVWWTPERCADLQRKNPRAYRTDVLGEFASGEAAVFDVEDIAATKRAINWSRYMSHGSIVVCDPSSGRGDAFTYAVANWMVPHDDSPRAKMFRADNGAESVCRNPDGSIIYEPADAFGPVLYLHSIGAVEGRFEGHVSGEDIAKRLAEVWRTSGSERVVGDQRESLMLSAALAKRGAPYTSIPWTATSKPVAVELVRRWLADGQLVIEDSAGGDRVRTQLLGYRSRFTSAGTLTYGARGVGVDDFVSLLVTAAHGAAEGLLRGTPLGRGRGVTYSGAGFM